MVTVEFFPEHEIDRSLLQYVIIVSRYQGQWLFVRQAGKDSWELPAGHLEAGETIYEGAFRELYEETGMVSCELISIGRYSVVEGDSRGYGNLFFAEIYELNDRPDSEIVEQKLFSTIPLDLTYPEIQPHFIRRVREFLPGQAN